MGFITNSHYFRVGITLLGMAICPLMGVVTNHLFMDGRLTPVFDRITVFAWANLCFTAFIPFFALTIWSYLIPFFPNTATQGPQGRAHSIAIVATAVFITILSAWYQITFWTADSAEAVANYVYAPFLMIAPEVLLYVVVWSLSFKVGLVLNTKRK